MKYKTNYSSPIGNLTLISDGEYLTNIIFEHDKFYEHIKKEAIKKDNLNIFKQTKTWLDKYFNGENPNINILELKPSGTPFQKKVWDILKTIPYGKTITYKEIAKQISTTMSARAVGSANSHNPIPIIIPCHRVVGASHNLTGYSGGIDIKIKLLKLEGRDITKYKCPKGEKACKDVDGVI